MNTFIQWSWTDFVLWIISGSVGWLPDLWMWRNLNKKHPKTVHFQYHTGSGFYPIFVGDKRRWKTPSKLKLNIVRCMNLNFTVIETCARACTRDFIILVAFTSGCMQKSEKWTMLHADTSLLFGDRTSDTLLFCMDSVLSIATPVLRFFKAVNAVGVTTWRRQNAFCRICQDAPNEEANAMACNNNNTIY